MTVKILPTLAELLAEYTDPADRLDALAGVVEADPGRWCRDTFYRQYDQDPDAGPGDCHSACLIGMAEMVWEKEDLESGRPLDNMVRAIGVRERREISGWNDDELRTPGEVARALRETARLERRTPA